MATQAEIEALAVRKEIEANLRAQAAGFSDAAARERDANERSIEAGFTSAVDQEIDANRRAREAGFLNAAVKENPAAAAPGTSINSNAPFVDPRSPVASRIPATPTAPRRPAGGGYGAGTLNNAMPSFQGPDYYNQMFNRPLQNWSQFMPANSRLAGGGGALYQNPWGYGTGGGSGWGGSFGGGGMMGGGMMGGGYPGGGFIGGGGYPGGGPFPGGSWFPGGGGGPLGPRPGSDKANDLAAGRTHHPQMYDLDDNWVGAEGGGAAEANWEGGGLSGAGAGGVPWQDTFLAPLGNRLGWNFAGYEPGQGQDMGSAEDDMLDAMEMSRAGIPDPRAGGRVFGQDDPLAYSDTSGYGFSGGPLADKQAYMDMMDITGQPGASFNDFSAANPYAAGPPGASFNDFSAANPYAAGTPGASFNDFSAANPYAGQQAVINEQMGIEMAARQSQAQAAANAAAIAAYGGGDYGLLEGGGGAEVDVSGGNGGRGGWEGGEHR